jgi:hypothetical protein
MSVSVRYGILGDFLQDDMTQLRPLMCCLSEEGNFLRI